MKKVLMFIPGLVAIALGYAPASRAANSEPIGLDFSLPPSDAALSDQSTLASNAPEDASSAGVAPLQIPSDATKIPSGKADSSKALTELPPPPAAVETPAPPPPIEVETASVPQPTAPVELHFEADQVAAVPAQQSAEPKSSEATPAPAETLSSGQVINSAPELDALFTGGNDSLIARAIGSAEGTRTPDGSKTSAYRGHKDPGNGKWNQGTFSYQHEASSPEEADRKQMTRLRKQAETLQQQAQQHGLQLSLEEKLNALDLANQSPRAALSRGGYIDRLKQARDMGLQGSEAVLWARTRAFLDPDTQRWNAPGLGNTVERITADQSRRQRAIARAIEIKGLPEQSQAPVAAVPPPSHAEDLAERIIGFDLSQLP